MPAVLTTGHMLTNATTNGNIHTAGEISGPQKVKTIYTILKIRRVSCSVIKSNSLELCQRVPTNTKQKSHELQNISK
jgi:hypothetical protein